MRKLDGSFVLLVTLIVILLATGGMLSGGTYLSLFNLQSMANQVPEIGLLAIGVMLAMSAGNGGIDLSGIAMANLAGVTSGLLALQVFPVDDAPVAFTILFVLGCAVVGLIGGTVNGLIISRLGITPILCTLGTQMLFTGITVVLSGGRAVRIGAPGPLYELGNGYFLGIPWSFLLFIFAATVLGIVLRFTPYGVKLMMTGSNQKAAEFSGFARAPHHHRDLCALRPACRALRRHHRRTQCQCEMGLRHDLPAHRHPHRRHGRREARWRLWAGDQRGALRHHAAAHLQPAELHRAVEFRA